MAADLRCVPGADTQAARTGNALGGGFRPRPLEFLRRHLNDVVLVPVGLRRAAKASPIVSLYASSFVVQPRAPVPSPASPTSYRNHSNVPTPPPFHTSNRSANKRLPFSQPPVARCSEIGRYAAPLRLILAAHDSRSSGNRAHQTNPLVVENTQSRRKNEPKPVPPPPP
jgi:hypothetical protein